MTNGLSAFVFSTLLCAAVPAQETAADEPTPTAITGWLQELLDGDPTAASRTYEQVASNPDLDDLGRRRALRRRLELARVRGEEESIDRLLAGLAESSRELGRQRSALGVVEVDRRPGHDPVSRKPNDTQQWALGAHRERLSPRALEPTPQPLADGRVGLRDVRQRAVRAGVHGAHGVFSAPSLGAGSSGMSISNDAHGAPDRLPRRTLLTVMPGAAAASPSTKR